jgi:hypothetical protein
MKISSSLKVPRSMRSMAINILTRTVFWDVMPVQQKFLRNILPPSSGLKSKLNQNQQVEQAAHRKPGSDTGL